MIVVDSSAIVAMLLGEPAAVALLTCLARAPPARPLRAVERLDRFLDGAGIDLAPVDAAQARLALAARIRYGRGVGHGGLLNFGDTFSYALAKALDAPLLFTGNDFGVTDVAAALGPIAT